MAAGGIDVIKMLPGGLSIQREQHSSTQRGSQLHPWMIKMLQDKENPKLKAKIHLIRGLYLWITSVMITAFQELY